MSEMTSTTSTEVTPELGGHERAALELIERIAPSLLGDELRAAVVAEARGRDVKDAAKLHEINFTVKRDAALVEAVDSGRFDFQAIVSLQMGADAAAGIFSRIYVRQVPAELWEAALARASELLAFRTALDVVRPDYLDDLAAFKAQTGGVNPLEPPVTTDADREAEGLWRTVTSTVQVWRENVAVVLDLIGKQDPLPLLVTFTDLEAQGRDIAQTVEAANAAITAANVRRAAEGLTWAPVPARKG